MTWDNWVADVSLADGQDEGLFCFVPLDGDPHGEHSLVVGLNYLSNKPPGKLIGVVHMDGQEACDEWCAAHPGQIHEWFGDRA